MNPEKAEGLSPELFMQLRDDLWDTLSGEERRDYLPRSRCRRAPSDQQRLF